MTGIRADFPEQQRREAAVSAPPVSEIFTIMNHFRRIASVTR
jgi:hypothetical protein